MQYGRRLAVVRSENSSGFGCHDVGKAELVDSGFWQSRFPDLEAQLDGQVAELVESFCEFVSDYVLYFRESYGVGDWGRIERDVWSKDRRMFWARRTCNYGYNVGSSFV
jgi:hypothetical protein